MYIEEHIKEWVTKYKPDHIESQCTKEGILRGALLVFGNLGVSIQWGYGSYADNYDLHWLSADRPNPSYTAECAIWYKGRGLGYYLNPRISPIRTANLLELPDGDSVTYKSEPQDVEDMIIDCARYARA